MKSLVKNQKRVGTAKKQKDIKHRRMNKHILELEAENAKLKELLGRASNWFNEHCVHGQLKLYDEIEQALKGESDG